MDTRAKILSLEQAAGLVGQARRDGIALRLVTGYFEPLLASHARRLREAAAPGGKLMVLVLSPERPILPVRARAELVAALAVADYVVPVEGGQAAGFLELLGPQAVLREEQNDRQRTLALIQHVHARQAQL